MEVSAAGGGQATPMTYRAGRDTGNTWLLPPRHGTLGTLAVTMS